MTHAVRVCSPYVLARGTPGASGYDLQAQIARAIQIQPGGRVVISTGVAVELPPPRDGRGLEVQIRPRSGLSRAGVDVALGTGDSDYRGILAVVLANGGREPVTINPGQRIAQLVFAEVIHPTIAYVDDVDDLSPTERGAGGFGSTGR